MKNQFQDIIPPDKRSIRNIPLPVKKDDEDSKKLRIKTTSTKSEEEILSSEKKEVSDLVSNRSKEEFLFTGVPKMSFTSKILLWCITVAVVLVLFFSITHLFKSAAISIIQKTTPIALSGPMTLYLNPKEGEVGYSTISVNDSATGEVRATGEKEVSTKASGTIVIYNNYSSATQKLVAGTRLETPAGLIFKLDQPVTVPGISKPNGKNVPGSIEAVVTAEAPGAEYNIGLADFTIPGFKGDPRYSAFYGRSKLAMSGGNVGKVATIEDAVLEKAVADLKEKLKASLLEKAQEQLPKTEQILDGFENISYAVSAAKLLGDGGSSNAQVKVEGTARVYAANKLSFAKKLLSDAKVSASTTEAFDIDFSTAKVSLVEEVEGSISVAFEGDVVITWNLPVEAFKNAIAGKSTKEVGAIATSFPEIDKVSSVVIRPFSFWSSSLPADIEKISITFDK